MRKIRNFLVMFMMAFLLLSVTNVNAAVDKKITFYNRSLQGVETYSGAGSTYKWIKTSTGETRIALCLNQTLSAPSYGSTLTLDKEVTTPALVYILNNGYGGTWNTSIVGTASYTDDQKYYITQLAIWMAQGSMSPSKINKTGTIGAPALALYNASQKYTITPNQISLTGGGAMTLSSDGKFFESPEFTINGSGWSKATLKLVNAPSEANILINGKQNKSGVKVSKKTKFKIQIPKGKVSGDMTVTINATATGTNQKAYRYVSSEPKKQNVVLLFKDSVTIKATATTTVKPRGSLKIQKVYSVAGKNVGNLAGVTIVVKNSAGKVVATWTTDSKNNPYIVKNLPLGKYTIEETKTPSGYIKDGKKTVTITTNNIASPIPVTLVNKKEPKGSLQILKVDVTSGSQVKLNNVKITVKNSAGKVVGTWTTNSTNNPYTIKDLPIGTYTIIEESAPAGYVKSKDIKITVEDNKILPVTLENTKSPNPTYISKQDATTSAELPGAHLVLKDSSGKVVEEWDSTTTPHLIKDLKAGKYTLSETIAPEGYQKTTEVVSFTVEDGKATGTVVMKNKPIPGPSKVYISKQDATTGAELPGAHLVLKDALGNVVEEWTSETTPHYVSKTLAPGKYSLTETIAPTGYKKTTSTVSFTVESDGGVEKKVVMKNEPIPDNSRIKISKQDITTGKELPGAKLTIKDANGKVIEEWVSTTTPHYVKDLPAGKYTLIESTAPKGYGISDEVIEFEVKADGGVEQTVVMYNSPIPVTADMNMTLIVGGLICTVALAGFSVFKLGHQAQ